MDFDFQRKIIAIGGVSRHKIIIAILYTQYFLSHGEIILAQTIKEH